MKFYHYTSTRHFRDIQSGRSFERTGLIPRRRLMGTIPIKELGLPAEADTGGIYGLLDPMDKNWCEKSYHPEQPLLQTVIEDISVHDKDKILLLEAQIRPGDDVRVADYGVHLHPKYDGAESTPLAILRKVKQGYWNSLVPLRDYLSEGRAYVVPEVISFTPVPLERLKVIGTFDQDELVQAIRAQGGYPQTRENTPSRHKIARNSPPQAFTS